MEIQWLEIIKASAPVVTAFIAYSALKNWQRQDKAKREIEFIDMLIDAVHSYIIAMSKPVALLELAKMGMDSHVPTWESGAQEEKIIKGAITYIQRNGEAEARRLAEALKDVEPSTIRLKSLAAKGQVFKLKDYEKCQAGVDLLSWQFERIEAFIAMLASPSLNWENPEVRRSLRNVISIDEDEIRRTLKDNNVIVLEFCSETYRRIYG